MRKKDELAIDKIIECAKKEFLEKGFEGASMRSIALNSSYTTGMLYARFEDKDALFSAVVKEAADTLYNYYLNSQNEFATYNATTQYNTLHDYVDGRVDCFVDIIYKYFDEFNLIIFKSKGSKYERYVDKLIDIETTNTVRYINDLHNANIKVNDVRADLSHMLATAMLNGIFEIVAHELNKDEAKQYVRQLHDFYDAGWNKLLYN